MSPTSDRPPQSICIPWLHRDDNGDGDGDGDPSSDSIQDLRLQMTAVSYDSCGFCHTQSSDSLRFHLIGSSRWSGHM